MQYGWWVAAWWGVMVGQLLAVEPLARPNILWISCEDTSPDLGCYGDKYAVTPNIDRLATEGVRFTRCFTHAGVCAPSRSGLITGCYPPSIGTHHMRCQGVPPVEVRCFPEYLRAAGYYCTNNVKTDYQFEAPPTAWDESSNMADWRGRKTGQPFFSVINFTTSHESQVRDPSPATQKLVAALPASSRHDPAQAPVWSFYPDTSVIRQDIANYYDIVSAMDSQVGEVIERLKTEGLYDDTIIFFWGDHGRGLSRCKRWLYDSGTHAPLIVRVPERWQTIESANRKLSLRELQPGTVNDDLVAFVDFAPTVLTLGGVFPLPEHLQGHVFLSDHKAPPRQYVYGHRDRMDETYDLIRMVRDKRYKYFRNFRHDLSYGQDISYMNQMPMMQEMRRLNAAGKLTDGPAQYFRATKPLEELFDTEADPHELQNLADNPQHRDVLLRLREECQRWMRSTGDLGLIPEAIFDELKRPDAYMSTTRFPQFVEQADPKDANRRMLSFVPSTPGSSIRYALLPTTESKPDANSWNLYTTPFSVTVGQPFAVQASRIGYQKTLPLTWVVGKPFDASPGKDLKPPPPWRDVIQQSGVLDRLLALRQADFLPLDERRVVYRKALDDEHPAVRYWGLWAWTQSPEMQDINAVAERLQGFAANDPDPLVRITAARALAMSTTTNKPIVQLVELVESQPQPAVRLAAITALQDLGEKTRPFASKLLPQPNDSEYVGRIKKALAERWKTSP